MMQVALQRALAIAAGMLAIAASATPATASSPYDAWSNGPDPSPDYFPIGVWAQRETDAVTWAAAGVNLYVGLWQGPTTQQLDALRAAGVQTIAAQNSVALFYTQKLSDGRPVVVGWALEDEPDNYPKTPASAIQAQAAQWKLNDSTRPLLLNLSQGLGWDDATWVGQGGQIDPAADYPAYLAASDIAAFDIYPSSETHAQVRGQLWRVGLGVDRLFQYRPGQQIVWNVIETGNVYGVTPDRRPTPAQIRAEVWMSIVHGARGIIYFIHGKTSFSDFDDRALLRPENAAYLSAITSLDAELHSLARVINAEPAVGVAAMDDVVGTSPVEFTARASPGVVHVFAVGMRDAATRKRFQISPPADGMVEVLGESRALPLSAGRFEDEFAGYQAHLYRVEPVPEPAEALAVGAATGALAALRRRASRRIPAPPRAPRCRSALGTRSTGGPWFQAARVGATSS